MRTSSEMASQVLRPSEDAMAYPALPIHQWGLELEFRWMKRNSPLYPCGNLDGLKHSSSVKRK